MTILIQTSNASIPRAHTTAFLAGYASARLQSASCTRIIHHLLENPYNYYSIHALFTLKEDSRSSSNNLPVSIYYEQSIVLNIGLMSTNK